MTPSIDEKRLISYVERLLPIHAPSGFEGEADTAVCDIMRTFNDAVWQDASGNIIAHIKGRKNDAPIAVISHKDEISMIVKRVEKDGRLRVVPVGGLHPWAIGETPVELLADKETVPGVLSIGAKHVSQASPAGKLKEGAPLTWEDMWVDCKQSASELAELGIRAGTRVCIARHRKNLWQIGSFLCGYNLDCRAGLAALFEVGHQLVETPPAQDVYIIASESEEIGGQGAAYALAHLPVDTAIAVDIAPAAAEYGTENSANPILIEKDGRGVYHAATNRKLETLARAGGFDVQKAVVTSYASDSSISRAYGHVARAALIGYPGDNTHGYEICSRDGIVNTTRLLLAYLLNPVS
jgi:putative aminopeptidase FrvX